MENNTPTLKFDITKLTLIALERAKIVREARKNYDKSAVDRTPYVGQGPRSFTRRTLSRPAGS